MQILMFIVHHTFRTLWSMIIGLIYAVAYWFIHFKSHSWKENKKKWDEIELLPDLILFFSDVYQYKWDGKGGLFDHDNSIWEFLVNFGDCDDAARFAAKKLRKLGYKARRVGFFCLKTKSWHYDCMFTGVVDDGKTHYYLFNYGKVLSGKTKKEVLQEFYKNWSNYPEGKTVCWQCYW